MSLFDLKSMVSVEDFADAHEPVNDGVREVPTAATIAADTTVADTKDISSAGDATTIPQAPEEPEGPVFDTVSESAETDDVSGTEEPVLEHDNAKDAEAELEKTTQATTALEAYAPRAKRFDIIGYPSVQLGQLTKMVGYLNRKSGNLSAVKVSAESIDGAVQLGRTRIAKLEREITRLKAKPSNEDISDSMGIDNSPLAQEIAVTEEPTDHGAPPVPAPVAAELSEVETDPLNVPILEIKRVEETVEALTQAGCAIEQYIQILRSPKGISKQAAAVMHAGLEHIDQQFGLRSRATGLEGFDTTPRSAMEAADVSEGGLLKRAGEIGAKILEWLLQLITHIENYTMKYQQGMHKVISQFEWISKAIDTKTTYPSITLAKPSQMLFIGDEFVGDSLTPVERELPKNIKQNRQEVMSKVIKPLVAIMKKGPASDEMAEEISNLTQGMYEGSERVIELAGGDELVMRGSSLHYTPKKETIQHKDYVVDAIAGGELKRSVDQTIDFLQSLNDTATGREMITAAKLVTDAIKDLRRRSKDVDESVFQRVQSRVSALVATCLSYRVYFSLLGNLAWSQRYRGNYIASRIGKGKTQD